MSVVFPVSQKMSFLIDDLLRDTHDANKTTADTPAEVTTGFPRYCFPPTNYSSCFGSDEDSTGSKDAEHPRKAKKKKMSRPSFAPYQVAHLRRVFSQRNYLTKQERRQLAYELNMKDEQVKTWFQNKRTKLKRKLAQEDEHYAQLLYLNDLFCGTQHHHDNQAQTSSAGYHSYQAPIHSSLVPQPLSSRDCNINNLVGPYGLPYDIISDNNQL